MQLSLELEFWTVDETGALAAATPELDRVDDLHAESAEPMLEVVTDPCDDVHDLRAEVATRLEEAIAVAREEDRRLVPLGTPLNAGGIDTTDGPRTRIQRQVVGDAFEHATTCAGTHLHVDRIDGAEADQLNLLTALDPAFALVASSPYHRGTNVAACARPRVYRRTCYADYPRLGQLWPYVDDVEEWYGQIDAAFAQFRRQALAAGVDRATFDEHFAPEDTTWAPIRLRDEFDTIEWRAPDIALPGQLLQLVEDVREVMARVENGRVEIGGDRGSVATRGGLRGSVASLPEFGRLRQHVDRAITHGLEAASVRRYLETMGFDPTEYDPITAEISEPGQLSRRRARRLRLRYADRLEADVEALTATRAPARAMMT